MNRRHPLTEGSWARTAETPPRTGKLLSVREGQLGCRYWRVLFQGEKKPVELIEGMLEFCPSEYAP